MEPPPKPKPRTTVGVRLTEDEIAWLDAEAKQRGMTRSGMAARVIARVRANHRSGAGGQG